MDRKVRIKQSRKPIRVKRPAEQTTEEEAPSASKTRRTEEKEEEIQAEETEETQEEQPEDQFEDEFEEDGEGDEVVDAADEEPGDEREELAKVEMDMRDMEEALPELKVWQPGDRALEEGEELVCEPSAYDMLHRMTSEWPCLSFDVIRDSLGVQRTRFPHTVYFAAGTQASSPGKNKILLLKVSQLRRTKHQRADDVSSSDDEGEDGDEGEEEEEKEGEKEEGKSKDEEDGVDDDPIMETREIKHEGGVNRLRCMPQQPHVIATWADTGKVNVWNVEPWLKSFDVPPSAKLPVAPRPVQSLVHKEEGFALDWSLVAEGCLVTGDATGSVYLWRPAAAAGAARWSAEGPFRGHASSVEDLQWSPTEPAVFASCSSDKTIRVWDARQKNAAMRVCNAHDSDVNVISWSRIKNFLMVSGSDDGSFRVWDLRTFQDGSPISDFRYHSKPITSIEWSPDDESTLAVACADNSVTIWDLSLEEDDSTPAATAVAASPTTAAEEDKVEVPAGVPPQLMFVHQGQDEIKEVHWHPQIPNSLISTSVDGFNIFKPSNL